MGEVLLIGGSPMIGKSTVAIEISSRLKWNCISSDDIGEALQTVVNINPFQNKNFLEYYAVTQCSKLIDDIIKYHKKIQPAILRLADIHSSWGNSIILEGWAIYPNDVSSIKKTGIKSVWLVAKDDLLEKRIQNNKAFYNENEHSANAVRNYIRRSLWHNSLILEQCKENEMNYVIVEGTETVDELAMKIINLLELSKKG